MKYFKKIVGEKIYLSPRNNEDVEIFTKWLNDFEITDCIGTSGNVVNLENERKYLQENNAPYSFSIVTLKEDKMIGTISLENVDSVHRCATLGIFIGDKDYHEKGIGTEAINLLVEFGFNYLNLHCINLQAFNFNKRALNCYKKCGFKETGRVRENRYINGKYYDSICMDILKSEFSGNYIKNKYI